MEVSARQVSASRSSRASSVMPRRMSALPLSLPRSSLNRYDFLIAGAIFVILVLESVSAVMTGLYMASDNFTSLYHLLLAAVGLLAAIWFVSQATLIIKAIGRGARSDGRSPARHITVAARRIGICLLFRIFMVLFIEFQRVRSIYTPLFSTSAAFSLAPSSVLHRSHYMMKADGNTGIRWFLCGRCSWRVKYVQARCRSWRFVQPPVPTPLAGGRAT